MVNIRPPLKPTLPEAPDGMALSVAPAAHWLWLEDYEYYDQLGRDPLQQAKVWLIKGTEERVAKLKEVIERYPKQMHRRLMLNSVAERGDEAMTRCFIETGMRLHPEFRDEPRPEEEEKEIQAAKDMGDPLDVDDNTVTPIHTAAACEHLGVVKLLLEEGNVPVDSRDAYGHTPLMRAMKNPEIVAYLLGKGSNPSLRTNPSTLDDEFVGQFPDADALEFAAAWANVEVLRMLLDHPTWGTRGKSNAEGGGPSIQVTSSSIISAAADNKGYEALKLLLEVGGYALRSSDGKTKAELLTEDQREAIRLATPDAIADGQLESMQLLLSYQYPTDIDGDILPFEIPNELRKPFTWGAYNAAKSDSVSKFEFINSLGVVEHDTMSLDKLPEGQKLNIQHLLDKAAEAGSVECVRLLIEKYGADPNKHRMPPGIKPLYAAASNDKPEVVRLLLEKYAADIHLGTGLYATGPTALCGAITFKSFGSIDLLLRAGGPVDYISADLYNITSPRTAILAVQHLDYKYAVQILSWEASAYFREQHNDWQHLNAPYVCLDLVPEDRGLIERLVERRTMEELKETGENARVLEEIGRVARSDKDEDGGVDIRKLTNAFPAPELKQRELAEDRDLMPKFEPWLKIEH